jgi:dephospho-CoA kinase
VTAWTDARRHGSDPAGNDRGPGRSRRRPLVVGLTGGIASGKSAATARFAALGVPVLDADVAARAVVEPGEPALAEIVAAFGASVLDRDGRLDRVQVRQRVFADAGARTALERIVHPRVQGWLERRIEELDAAYCVVAIPLLVETGPYPWLDRIVVVDVPEAVQLERLVARDSIAPRLAQAMIAAQASRERRLAAADHVLDNSGGRTQLELQVDALHQGLLREAQRRDQASRQ